MKVVTCIPNRHFHSFHFPVGACDLHHFHLEVHTCIKPRQSFKHSNTMYLSEVYSRTNCALKIFVEISISELEQNTERITSSHGLSLPVGKQTIQQYSPGLAHPSISDQENFKHVVKIVS
jgi:hypothetical protein